MTTKTSTLKLLAIATVIAAPGIALANDNPTPAEEKQLYATEEPAAGSDKKDEKKEEKKEGEKAKK